jgi:hypothetical protein
LKGAVPRAGGAKLSTILEWLFTLAVGVAPIAYNFMLREREIMQDRKLFIATVVWAVLFISYAIYTRVKQGRAIEKWAASYAGTANAIGGQIEGLTRLIYAANVPRAIQPHVREILLLLLTETCEAVRRLATYPGGTDFCSALLLLDGEILRATQYAPSSCTHLAYSEVRVGEPGAGQAFADQEPKVIEDTKDPCWGDQFTNPRYRSFVSFAVVVGGRRGRCLGCVTVDCSEPYVITDTLTKKLLYDAVRPQLESIGLALMYAEETGTAL